MMPAMKLNTAPVTSSQPPHRRVLARGDDPPGTPRGPARLPIPPSLAWLASRQASSRGPCGEPVVSFTPMLAPLPRGILATCTAPLRDPGTTTVALRDALAAAYEGAPFVRLLPEGRWPSTAATNGSNMAHLQSAADAHAGRAVVVAALDNLGKGAAGQAANLMLGLPETTGLSQQGVCP